MDFESTNKKLLEMGSIVQGQYAFRDHIFQPNISENKYDLNKEFVRIRAYEKTNWDQKSIELMHKIKPALGTIGLTKTKIEFDQMEQAIACLEGQYYEAFSFYRTGIEYKLKDSRIFLEDIEGLSTSLEIITVSEKELDWLLKQINPLEIVENQVNYHKESGLFKIYWERFLVLENETFLANVGKRNSFIASLSIGAKIPIMTISEAARDAIKNCAKQLKLVEERGRAELEAKSRAKMARENKIEATAQKMGSIAPLILGRSSTKKDQDRYVKWFKEQCFSSPTEELSYKYWAAYFTCVEPDNMTVAEYEIFKKITSIRPYLPRGRLEEMEDRDSRRTCSDRMCTLF